LRGRAVDLTLAAVERGCTMKSPQPQFQERRFLVSWWKAVRLEACPQGAKKVKDAVPVLSTHICLKRLPARSDRMAAGSMAFTAWSTPQHNPAPHIRHGVTILSQSGKVQVTEGVVKAQKPCLFSN